MLSEHVGDTLVLADADTNTTSRSPTAGVIATVRSDVPDVPPPAALVLYVAIGLYRSAVGIGERETSEGYVLPCGDDIVID